MACVGNQDHMTNRDSHMISHAMKQYNAYMLYYSDHMTNRDSHMISHAVKQYNAYMLYYSGKFSREFDSSLAISGGLLAISGGFLHESLGRGIKHINYQCCNPP